MKKPLSSIVTLALAGLMTSAAQAANVEVLHYWTSGGEAKSVAELKKMMEAKGHVWKDFAVAGGGGDAAMTALKARVVAGNAPVAAQIKGPDIHDWNKDGALSNINDAAKEWDKLLPAQVSAVMKSKGNYVAAPVNVHRVNWLWINQAALNKAGGKAPQTMDEFFKLADEFKKQGLVAIAHGGQPWQDATVFESVALGVGGAAYFDKAFVKLDAKELGSATTVKVFDAMAKIKTYIDKDAPGREWNAATAMIMNNKAGMQFMGDWAKGEFSAAGKVSGKDYACAAAPGTANAYTFNIDSFAMFKVKDPAVQKGQLDLATAIMSPEFQEVFNLNKGSIPVRTSGVKTDKFDACAKQSIADFASTAKNGGLVPSWAHGMSMPSAAKGAVTDVIAKFMNSTVSSKDATAALVKAAATK